MHFSTRNFLSQKIDAESYAERANKSSKLIVSKTVVRTKKLCFVFLIQFFERNRFLDYLENGGSYEKILFCVFNPVFRKESISRDRFFFSFILFYISFTILPSGRGMLFENSRRTMTLRLSTKVAFVSLLYRSSIRLRRNIVRSSR